MIFIFKTSVKTKRQVRALHPEIDKILSKAKWNFDLEDCDKILRIESEVDIIFPIIMILKIHNFNCTLLE